MIEIYLTKTLFHQNWLNIFEISFVLWVFFIAFIFPLLWFFYLLSSNRGNKFKKTATQLLIFLIISVLSFIIGLGSNFIRSYGDFNKIITDGNEYTLTHSIKFWKEHHFKKADVKEIYKTFLSWEYLPYLRKRGYVFILELKSGQVLHSDFVSYQYTVIEGDKSAEQRADKLLSATGLTGEQAPVSVYPQWYGTSDFLNKLKKSFFIGFATFAFVAIVMGGIILFFRRISKSSQKVASNFSETQTNNFGNFSTDTEFKDFENIMKQVENNRFSTKSSSYSTVKKSLQINGISYHILVKQSNGEISIECNGMHYNSPEEIENRALRKEVQQIIDKNT